MSTSQTPKADVWVQTKAPSSLLKVKHDVIYLMLCIFAPNVQFITYSAKRLKCFFRDKGSIKAEKEYRCIGKHPPQNNKVVHVGTGHLYQPNGRRQEQAKIKGLPKLSSRPTAINERANMAQEQTQRGGALK